LPGDCPTTNVGHASTPRPPAYWQLAPASCSGWTDPTDSGRSCTTSRATSSASSDDSRAVGYCWYQPGLGRARRPDGRPRPARCVRPGRSSAGFLSLDVVADGGRERVAGDLLPALFERGDAQGGGEPGEVFGARTGGWVGELVEQRHAPDHPGQRLARPAALLGQQAELYVGEGHAGPV